MKANWSVELVEFSSHSSAAVVLVTGKTEDGREIRKTVIVHCPDSDVINKSVHIEADFI